MVALRRLQIALPPCAHLQRKAAPLPSIDYPSATPGLPPPTGAKAKRRRRRPRKYHPAEHAQAIYLAGGGQSASAIAEVIGKTTPARVRALLSSYGVPLLRRTARQTAMVILIKDENATAIARGADAKGVAPAQMIGEMIDETMKKRRVSAAESCEEC